MPKYKINKGIGHPAEFQGLKSQYLFLFAGGLLAVFVLFVVMYMIGISQFICIVSGIVSAAALVYFTFNLNTRYGEHGLMKLQASRRHPRYITSRRKISKLFGKNIKAVKYEEYF